MSVTAATVAKKVGAFLVSEPKILKKVLGIILVIIIVILMPVIAIISILNGGIEFDTNRLQEIVVERMSEEEKAKLQFVEDTMYGIENAMTNAGYDAQRVKEAQVIYVLALGEQSKQSGFTDKLVGCFAAEQTDGGLIQNVNNTFGVQLKTEDFTNVMKAIRAVYIPTDTYTDPTTKNNLDLVEWAKNAQNKKWGYVYGTYGSVLTEELYNSKAEQYPNENGGENGEYIKAHYIGNRVSDCVGLIKGYGWLNADTHEVEYASNGMPDIGADGMYQNATEKGTIDTIPETPGLAVWQSGHIGIYIGGGKVIHAANTKDGVILSELSQCGFTHWLKIPYITYIEETE